MSTSKKSVLVACEYSGAVREAFMRMGWNAWSCDLLPTDIPGQHYQGDVLEILDANWDLVIAHPPCTYLTVSGNRWFLPRFASRFPDRQQNRKDAIAFFMAFANCKANHVAIENPVGIMSTAYRKPDQVIQPWMFGHMEQKATCLWLKNLPALHPTRNVRARMMQLPERERQRLHYLPPSADRWKLRSKTFSGVANAMAAQWSEYILAESTAEQ
jgi:site-specific DNA-cytosine methylase